MSRIAEDLLENRVNPPLQSEPVLDWPVVKIPDAIAETIGEAAARTVDLLEAKEQRIKSLTEAQLEIARKYGVRFEEFDNDIIAIRTDISAHRTPRDDIGHYFGSDIMNALNKPDSVYNLGLLELTREGYKNLCNRYNPAAYGERGQTIPTAPVDKPIFHGEKTDSGKIKVIMSGRKIYPDWQRAASNDPIEEGDDE